MRDTAIVVISYITGVLIGATIVADLLRDHC